MNKIYSNKNKIYSNKNKIYRNTHVNIQKSTTVLADPGTQQRSLAGTNIIRHFYTQHQTYILFVPLVVYVSQCNQTVDQIPQIMHLFNHKSTCNLHGAL